LLGVESGAEGFAKLGRGVAGLSVAARVPYNPVDLTFGNRRIRPFPLLNLTVKPVLYWSDHTLPDSLRNALELTPAITYNIPVGENLYLQVNAEGTYSTLPMQHYRYAYDVGLGYITDGNIQIVAKYQQGNGLSGLTYDKRLLLGIALETLNLARGR
jgi:hypothetical protein